MPDRAATLAAVREKYPVYADISDDELGTRLAAKYPKEYGFLAKERVDSIPVAPKGAAVAKPTVSGFLGKALKERGGDIGAMIGATVAPGSGLAGLASRVLASEAGHDVGQAVTGQKVSPGYGGATQLAGEALGRVVSPFLSPTLYRRFASETARRLGDWLKTSVPSWSGLPSTEKGLYEMAHGTGQRLLSADYERALQGIKGAIPAGKTMEIPMSDKSALGLTRVIDTAPREGREMVQVEIRDVIDALPGARKSSPAAYRRALRGVDHSLEDIEQGLGEAFMKQRAEYKAGAGFMEFAERGKFLHGETFDPVKAQRAFDQFGKRSLLSRDLDPIRAIIRPGAQPITAAKHSPWSRRLQGALAGEAVGYPLGASGYLAGPVIGGAIGERVIPETTYRNVPMSPALNMAARVATPLAAQAIREGGRLVGVPEMWPGP
jgi:hypothetical protein